MTILNYESVISRRRSLIPLLSEGAGGGTVRDAERVSTKVMIAVSVDVSTVYLDCSSGSSRRQTSKFFLFEESSRDVAPAAFTIMSHNL